MRDLQRTGGQGGWRSAEETGFATRENESIETGPEMMKVLEVADMDIKTRSIGRQKYGKKRSRRYTEDLTLILQFLEMKNIVLHTCTHTHWMRLVAALTQQKVNLAERYGNRNYSK